MPKSKYPIEDWADGSPHVLVQGRDFECRPVSMKQLIHYYARNRDMKAKTSISADAGTVTVQFLPGD